MEVFKNQLTESNSRGFEFFGNESAFFRGFSSDPKVFNGFSENTFVFKPYHDKKVYEYDFEGNFIQEHDEKEWDKANYKRWYEEHPKNGVQKVAKTFEDSSNFKYHNIKTEKHSHRRTIQHTGFSNESDFQIMNDFNLLKCDESEVEEWTCGSLVLSRFSKGLSQEGWLMFVISKNNQILSIMKNSQHDFCDGDSGTHVFILKNKNIFVFNDGDSPSVLFIRNDTNDKLYVIEDKIIKLSQDMKNYWTQFKQSIVNLFYSIIDEEKYGLWESSRETKLCNSELFRICEREKRKVIVRLVLDNDHMYIISDDEESSEIEINLNDLSYNSVKKILEEFDLFELK